MPEHSTFLQDLAIILSLAALATIIFQRLRLPVVAGYLIAGVALGPNVAVSLIGDPATVRTLAEIGVILLMMFVGLEFRIRRVARIGARVGVAVLIEVGLMLALGFGLASVLGWGRVESLLAAGMVAISSTAVIAKAYEEHPPDWRLKDLVFSLLVLEDLVAIVLVAIATTVAVGGSVDLGRLLGKLALVLVGMVLAGLLLVPPILRAVVRLGRRETILVTAIGLTFLAALVTHRAGYSVALGSFVAGVLMSESGVGHQIGEIVQPVRDLFAAVFFVAVGMLLDVRAALEAWPLILLFTALVVVGKAAGITLGTFVTGFGTRMSVQAGQSMAQIGEFSFIIAGLGLAANVGSAPLYSIAVTTAIVTAFLTPTMVARSERTAIWVDRHLPRRLQTFSSLYGAWLDQLAAGAGTASPWRRGRRLIWLLIVDSAVVAFALIATSIGWRSAGVAGWLARLGVPSAFQRGALLAVGAAVAIPFAFGLVRAGRRLARVLADSVVPPVMPGKVDQGRSPRRLLTISLEAAITLAVGVPLVAVTLPFLPPLGAPGVIAALLLMLGFAFWRTARDLDSHARAGAELVVHVLGRRGAAAESLDDVRRMLPGLGDFEPVRIDPGSAADHRTLGQLNLRGRTGATVVGVFRGGIEIPNPDGDQQLLAGDLVALTGSHDAIDAASRILGGTSNPPPAAPAA